MVLPDIRLLQAAIVLAEDIRHEDNSHENGKSYSK
jgi:hypothetical protein